MRATLQEVEPRTAAEQDLYAEGLDRISRFGRQEDTLCGSQGGPARRPVGRSGVWGGGGSRFHLPLWLAEQLGAQADGDVANGSDRAGTIHGRGDGASVLWGC